MGQAWSCAFERKSVGAAATERAITCKLDFARRTNKTTGQAVAAAVHSSRIRTDSDYDRASQAGCERWLEK